MRVELDAKLLEIKHLQMKLNSQESHAVGTAMEHVKEVNKTLEKENNELKVLLYSILLNGFPSKNLSFSNCAYVYVYFWNLNRI